jgi:photosystem II stability/assembly factor-like uncharacterized protein
MKKIHIFALAGIVVAGMVTLLIFKNGSLSGKHSDNYSEKEGKEDIKEERAHIRDLQTYFDGIHNVIGQKKSPAPAGYLMQEYTKVKNATGRFKAATPDTVIWIQRGPANVGGRTRGLIVDPSDPTHHTWYAGSATGGAWKTTDAGATWTCLTNNIPYQATTTLAMSKSNNQVIYMGTGESFEGSIYTTGGGVFRSTDRGDTWQLLDATAYKEDFRYINRIVIDPHNDSIILVAATKGIFKSVDAGQSWYQTYASIFSVDDLVADSGNFNNIFAGVNSFGIIRSVNAGETWEKSSNGLGGNLNRIELAISPTNTQKIYASVNIRISGSQNDKSQLYSSWDHGDNWQLVVNTTANNFDFLGAQGSYDNTIAVNPYNENIVYWGGVNLWKVQLTSSTQPGDTTVTAFDKVNTESFLDFIPFDGNLFPGMNTGDQENATNLSESDFVSVEVRFGPGMHQKAHRFFVPPHDTSGVPYTSYTYQDYIDVPFEVWDVTNNRQLMCSFRDQERDGTFNLYERTGNSYGELGREYIFINAVPYNATIPDPHIATTGGRSYKLIYFFWPTLATGGTWDPNNLPDSKVVVVWSIITERVGNIQNVSDAYNSYGGNNSYDQSSGLNTLAIPGFHADHHELVMIPVNPATQDFWILNGNDGGLGISYDKGVTFTQIKQNYFTTQFYGVAKKPYRNEYIGGMQDNGTWQSPIDVNASIDTGFYFRIGGDGFETVWNHQDSNKILGSVYNNLIRLSIDHGHTWQDAVKGIASNDGPFITKLTAVPSNNKIIFAVGNTGLYKTANFTIGGWRPVNIGSGWLGTDQNGQSFTLVTSSHNVKVSPANEQIVWAGAAMIPDLNWKMFVSTDQGDYFNAVNAPNEPIRALMSGFAVHPTNENTAYALYSLYGKPKIYRTTDLGQHWVDITQVDAGGVSANGFPNVGCLSLMVFPDDTMRIWAGTEIGIMESLDNGETWHYLESELPAVAIWQMFMQDNQIVVATYGRGIWTYQYGEPAQPPPVVVEDKTVPEASLGVYPNPTTGIVNFGLPDRAANGQFIITVYSLNGRQVYTTTESVSGNSPVTIDLGALQPGTYLVSVISNEIRYTARIVKQ